MSVEQPVSPKSSGVQNLSVFFGVCLAKGAWANRANPAETVVFPLEGSRNSARTPRNTRRARGRAGATTKQCQSARTSSWCSTMEAASTSNKRDKKTGCVTGPQKDWGQVLTQKNCEMRTVQIPEPAAQDTEVPRSIKCLGCTIQDDLGVQLQTAGDSTCLDSGVTFSCQRSSI